MAARHARDGCNLIVALLVAPLATIAASRRRDRPAWLLLGPTLLWVAYAAFLNAAIVVLN